MNSVTQQYSRKNWLDWAKVFGIALVILGYFTPDYKETYSSQLLYSFHMPLFFIISGFLCKYSQNIDFCSYVNKINKRLLIPYFLLCIIEWGIEAVIRV